MGVVGGIAINTAHELGHKRASSERWLSRVALAQTGYGHFFIEHNRGHHVRVATPEDPASSRLGESFWAFLPRTVAGSLRSAWGIEAARLDRLGKSHWTLHNDILGAWAMTVVLFAALAIVFGPVVLPYLLIQAVIGFSLLEVVNYLEHYGLLRSKREDGRYERCLPEHSWNSNNVASNVLLYHLQRHTDHHANPTRRYQALRHVDEAPQLPTGYAGMIVLAWFPPLWRRVMDPRLLDHFDGDVTRANIQPRKRGRVLARYGRPALVSAWRCPGCGYVYDEEAGHPREGFPPGTPWSEVPDDWACPDCGVRDKVDFEPDDEATSDRRRCDDGGDGERAHPLPARRPGSCCARPSSAPPATSSSSGPGRRSRCPTSPPPPASAARPSTRSSATATSSASPSSSTRASASSTRSRRRSASTSTTPAPRSAPRWSSSSAPPARTR